jgi:hypothetical protein
MPKHIPTSVFTRAVVSSIYVAYYKNAFTLVVYGCSKTPVVAPLATVPTAALLAAGGFLGCGGCSG